jgi:hypothetical protein
MNSERHEGPGRCGRRFFWKAPLILVFIALKGVVVMYLWNYLVPEIFHGPELNYLQAIGLMVLSKLLLGFGGFGHFRRHHMHHRHGPMGRHFWKHMSEEERQKLREKLRGQEEK